MLGVPGWKDRYIQAQVPENDDDEGLRGGGASYVEGLCWVMRYYYDGCQSWKWFFPYHYAPFAADIANAITPERRAAMSISRRAPPSRHSSNSWLCCRRARRTRCPRRSPS